MLTATGRQKKVKNGKGSAPQGLLVLAGPGVNTTKEVAMLDRRREPVMYRAAIALGVLLLATPGIWAQASAKVAEHVRDLQSSNAQARAQAALALGKLGKDAEIAVPAMVRALKDDDAEVRSSVLYALGQLGPIAKSAAADVALRLKDKSGAVRKFAAQALGELKVTDDGTVNALMDATTDDEVAPYAINTLGKMGPDAKRAVPALAKCFEKAKLREHAAWALGKIGKESLAVLTKALEHKDANARIDAILGLTLIGPEVVPHLARVLGDTHADVRLNAASALGKMGAGAKEAVPELTKALMDKDVDVRQRAAQALGKIGPAAEPSLPALKRLLERRTRDADAIVRDTVETAIASIEGKK
jgi:HEAT repeat protein